MLHRFARLAGRAGVRLRHPVQVRHFQAGIRQGRQAGRKAGLLAGQRRAVGPRRLQPRPEGLLRRRSGRGERQACVEAGLVRARGTGRLHGSGLRFRPREHAAPVERQELRRVRSAHLQQVRVSGRRQAAGRSGEHLQDPVPGGLHPAGQGASSGTAVLLRGRVHPRRHPRLLPGPGQAGSDDLRRQDHLPAQRHPPGHRHPRAHARADRRVRLRLGHRVEGHQQDLQLHLPHPASGSPGSVAGRSHRQAAATPSGDYQEDQRAVRGRAQGQGRRRRDHQRHGHLHR